MKDPHTLKSAILECPPAEPSGPAPVLSLRVLRTLPELESLRGVWTSWKGHRDSDIDFFIELVESREEVLRPHVIVVYRQGRIDALLVGRLENTRIHSKVGYLSVPGLPARSLVFSYGGFRGNPSPENSTEFVKSIIASLKDNEADIASLDHLQMESPLCHRALTLPAFATRDHFAKPETHYLMALPENMAAVYKGLSNNHRWELRRKSKRFLSIYGDKAKVRCFREAADVDVLMPEIEAVARKTYQRGLGVGFQDTEQMRRRLRLCAAKGWLRGYILQVSNVPVAFWIGTAYNGSFCSDYLGFDPGYGEYSPGTFLLTKVIEDLCSNGIAEIDFGFGDARYKGRFGNRQLAETTVRIFAPSPKGVTLNLILTLTVATNHAFNTALERTRLLPIIKRYWRGRLARGSGRQQLD